MYVVIGNQTTDWQSLIGNQTRKSFTGGKTSSNLYYSSCVSTHCLEVYEISIADVRGLVEVGRFVIRPWQVVH